MKNLYTIFFTAFFLTTIFCSSQSVSAMAVDSLELPIAAFETNNTTICGTESFIIRNQSTNFIEVIWEIEGIINPTVYQNGNVSVSFSEAGMYDVMLVAVNECGSDTLKVEDYLTIHDALEVQVSKSHMGYECGIGEVYRLCAESDAEVESYHWFNNCLSDDNTGPCCDIGVTHGLFPSHGAVSVMDSNGCEANAQSGDLYGDWEYVQVSWVEAPLSFCEGEPISIPSGTVVCYPPGCTVSYEDIDINEPGSHSVPAKARYRTCTQNTSVGVVVLSNPNFKESYKTVCVDEYCSLQFNSFFHNLKVYVNGAFYGYDSFISLHEPGIYEVTALNQYIGTYSSSECLSVDTLYVEVLPLPSIELEYEEKICRNTTDEVTITANPIEGLPPYSYKWKINSSPIETDTSVLIIPISELPNDHYSVFLTTTHNNGCSFKEQRIDFDIEICNNIEENSLSQLFIHQITSNQLLVQSENLTIGNFNLSFYDLSGRKVLQQDFFNTNTNTKLQQIITLQNINSGIYVLQLQGENGETLRKKVWVE